MGGNAQPQNDFASGIRQEMFGRQPGQGFGSRPGANGPAGWQPQQQFRADLGNAAGGGGSVTAAIQAERARQGLGARVGNSMGNTGWTGGMQQMGNPEFTRMSQSLQGMMGQNSQPQSQAPFGRRLADSMSSNFGSMQGQGKGPSPQQQAAQGAGGRNGLGNPFNDPYGPPRYGGYDFNRK